MCIADNINAAVKAQTALKNMAKTMADGIITPCNVAR